MSYSGNVSLLGERNLVRTFNIEITKSEVEQYFYVEPEPEPEPEPEEDKENILIEEPIRLPCPIIPKPKRSNPATFARLTQLNRIPRKSKQSLCFIKCFSSFFITL